jgi:SAM-dependent methyltransferase
VPLRPEQLQDEVDFIDESLAIERGGVVLDLACGAGAYSVELSRRGYAVVGYDLSVSQLARSGELAQRHDQKISFLQGDAREMSFEQMFDGVFCWNASFGFFEEEKNQVLLGNVFRALKPGGAFLLDVPNRDFLVRQQPMQSWFEGDNCVCMDDMHVDFITSRLMVKRTVMLDDGRNREWHYTLRIYALHELGKMLHDQGFRVAQVSGQVATPAAFLGSHSPRIIILAIKPNDEAAG